MEKRVFRKFMDNDVVQKTIVFANAFNLDIDGWRSVNSEEHPHLIIFYCGETFVGYIDADYQPTLNYVGNYMSFILFTPFGKVIGRFSTYENLFKYSLENRKDSFSELNGLFKVQESKYKQLKNRYRIASTFTLTDLEGSQIRVVFNDMVSNYIVDIRKSGKNMCEEVRLLFRGNSLCIEHFAYPNLRKRQDIAKIKVTLEDEAESFSAIFDFLGNVPYQKNIELKCKSSKFEPYNNYEKLQSVDYDDIASEIAENDSALFDFIDEIRNRLTFLANGFTPVSFYDRIARLCFYREGDKFKLDFSGAKDAKIDLEHNLILKTMERHEQERK